MEARLVYVLVLGTLFAGTKALLRPRLAAASRSRSGGLWDIHGGLVLLAALLSRPHNLPVLLSSLAMQAVMAKFVWTPLRHEATGVTVMHYWLGQAFFYFQVGSPCCRGWETATFLQVVSLSVSASEYPTVRCRLTASFAQ